MPVSNQTIDPLVIQTTQQLEEFPYNEDLSGTNNNLLGIGWAQSSMNDGARVSSSTSYLASSNDRPNLTVLINAMVTKLLPTNTPAGARTFRTVQFSDAQTFSGEIATFYPLYMVCLYDVPVTPSFQVQATKEVILSAGAVGTPQVLQLSGIGNPADLTPLNIPVLVNSPQVGKNLQDHPLLPNIFTVQGDTSLDHVLRDATDVGDAISQWETNRTGFISNNVINNLGFARLNSTVLGEFPEDPAAGPTTPHFEMVFTVRGVPWHFMYTRQL